LKTIVEPREIPAKTWGEQKPKDCEYRLLKYTLQNECEDGTLLLNVVTGQMVLLDETERSLIDSLPAGYGSEMEALVKAHFLVPVGYDEKKAVDQLRKLMNAMGRRKEITGYTILPTTCCNARCFYCYEAGIPHITMAEETVEELIRFIAANHGDQQVDLGWFGGEPTLGIGVIDRICTALKEQSIDYISSMISNGYLLNEEIARKAKDLWKLTNIQITLDGTEEVYNKVKSYVNIQDSAFQRVLKNIGHLLNREIRVSVRMNLDRHNADNLEQLIRELASRFGGQKLFTAYVHVLFDDCGFKPVSRSDSETVELWKRANELNALIRAKGMSYDRGEEGLPAIKASYCMADGDRAVLVNPDGSFSKCEHYCGKEKVGDLWHGITDTETVADWKERVWFPECETCPVVPSCAKLKKCFSCQSCIGITRENDIEMYKANMRSVYEKNGKGEHCGKEVKNN